VLAVSTSQTWTYWRLWKSRLQISRTYWLNWLRIWTFHSLSTSWKSPLPLTPAKRS
jgi:hypothetical protein